jgi:hypothetical protein
MNFSFILTGNTAILVIKLDLQLKDLTLKGNTAYKAFRGNFKK